MRPLLDRLEATTIQRVSVRHDQFAELAGHPLGEVNSDRVEHYRGSATGDQWAPIITVGPHHAVLDGRHRVAAARAMEATPVVLNIPEAAYERLAGDGGLPARSLEEIAAHVIERYRAGRGTLDA